MIDLELNGSRSAKPRLERRLQRAGITSHRRAVKPTSREAD
jgi:hypothetical protein